MGGAVSAAVWSGERLYVGTDLGGTVCFDPSGRRQWFDDGLHAVHGIGPVAHDRILIAREDGRVELAGQRQVAALGAGIQRDAVAFWRKAGLLVGRDDGSLELFR